MTDAPGHRSMYRLFEWYAAISIFGEGVTQAIYPTAFDVSKFQYMLDRISGESIGVYCLVVGGIRCVALFHNGRLGTFGAVARIITAIGSAMVWFQMGYSLYLTQAAVNGPPSPALSHYVALVFAELYSAFRAGRDARVG